MGSMTDAYKVAGRTYRHLQAANRPEELRRLDESDVIVVAGCYDRAETTLGALDLRWTSVDSPEVGQLRLTPNQTVIVNCPGNLDDRGIDRVRSHVDKGGKLVTTDWALGAVLARAFPGYVERGGHNTGDDVVGIQMTDAGKSLLGDLLDSTDAPRWWLEGSSHPIRVVDPGRVEVLLESPEMKDKYGERPIVVRFNYGHGVVYHMVSHIYLQRTEERSRRQRADAAEFLAKKGALGLNGMLKDDQTVGEVEAAFAGIGLMGKILAAPHRDDGEDK